jgi:hypothetical protein
MAGNPCENCHGMGTTISGTACGACSGSGDIADTGGTVLDGRPGRVGDYAGAG